MGSLLPVCVVYGRARGARGRTSTAVPPSAESPSLALRPRYVECYSKHSQVDRQGESQRRTVRQNQTQVPGADVNPTVHEPRDERLPVFASGDSCGHEETSFSQREALLLGLGINSVTAAAPLRSPRARPGGATAESADTGPGQDDSVTAELLGSALQWASISSGSCTDVSGLPTGLSPLSQPPLVLLTPGRPPSQPPGPFVRLISVLCCSI